MEAEPAMHTSAPVTLPAPPEASGLQRWASGVLALLCFMTFWGAWVLLIGARPCALSYLLWR
jgi:hypothetical protein